MKTINHKPIPPKTEIRPTSASVAVSVLVSERGSRRYILDFMGFVVSRLYFYKLFHPATA